MGLCNCLYIFHPKFRIDRVVSIDHQAGIECMVEEAILIDFSRSQSVSRLRDTIRANLGNTIYFDSTVLVNSSVDLLALTLTKSSTFTGKH